MRQQVLPRFVVLVVCVAAGVVAAAACSSFEEEPLGPGTDAGTTPVDAPLTTADAGCRPLTEVDASCAAPCVAVMPSPIQSLSCDGSDVYVGLTSAIVKVTKDTGLFCPYLPLGAQHLYAADPVVFSEGTNVRAGDGGVLASGQTGLTGVAVSATAAYWSRGNELWSRAFVGGGPVQIATIPAEGQGVLLRGGLLYVAVPSLKRVHARDPSGSDVDAGLDVVTNDGVFALASSGSNVYWVAPAEHAIRYAPWDNRAAPKDLVVGDAGAGAMRSVCADLTHVYFGVGAELRRVSAAP